MSTSKNYNSLGNRLTIACLAGLFTGIAAEPCRSQSNSKAQWPSSKAQWPSSKAQWQTVSAKGRPTARHEAALVGFENQLLLLGGRRVNPVDVFDPATGRWTEKSKSPIEMHHFQAVTLGEAIYIVGAMNGPWPNEKPLENVLIYFPKEDRFQVSHAIPAKRRRGGAGAVVYDQKIYLVGGITNGHQDGTVAWTDQYDPASGKWRELPDAPNPRDHFQAVAVGDQLIAAAGRRTMQRTGHGFDLTVSETDIFDLPSERWLPGSETRSIPTLRAGNSAIAVGGMVIVGGGESSTQKAAHHQVEVFDPASRQWQAVARLQQGRHGTGFALIGDHIYTASGSGNRGGGPELTTLEKIAVEDLLPTKSREAADPQR